MNDNVTRIVDIIKGNDMWELSDEEADRAIEETAAIVHYNDALHTMGILGIKNIAQALVRLHILAPALSEPNVNHLRDVYDWANTKHDMDHDALPNYDSRYGYGVAQQRVAMLLAGLEDPAELKD